MDPDGRFGDTIWDICVTLYDFGKAIYQSCNGDNSGWIDVGLDAAALLLPCVPAGLSKVDDVVDAYKCISKTTNKIPSNVSEALTYINKGNCVPGTNGGKIFKNRGGINPKTGNPNQILPKIDSSGNPITYKEWYVNVKQIGETRNAERIVTGSDGSVYWTTDHYETFTKLE